MKRNINIYLGDILESIELIEKYSKSLFINKFKKSKKNQDAIIRRLEIIGEAIKKIPKEIKDKYPEVKWQEFAGIRDFLSHVYFGINIDRIWGIIKKEIPILKKQIKIIKEKNDK